MRRKKEKKKKSGSVTWFNCSSILSIIMHKFLKKNFLQLPMYLHTKSSFFLVDFVVGAHPSLLCVFLVLKKNFY